MTVCGVDVVVACLAGRFFSIFFPRDDCRDGRFESGTPREFFLNIDEL